MNSIAKFLIAHAAVTAASRLIVRGIEIVAVKINPEAHESYVDLITETLDAKTEAFVLRNANLVQKYAPSFFEARGEAQKAAEEASDIISGIFKEFVNGKKTSE